LESRCYSGGPDCYAVNGVWSNASNDIFAVGSRKHGWFGNIYHGLILHYDGTTFTEMASPTSRELVDVWGNSGSNVYAVGAEGVFHYDGTRWSKINDTPGWEIWGTATDVFVLAEGAILHGTY
jgi:hypothetical protein